MIPAIDLLGGRAAFMVGGKPGTEQIVSEQPVSLALEWERRGAKRLHVVDLDAAMGIGDNRDLLQSILMAVKVSVQVGGGLRDQESLEYILSHGASWAIIGTRAILDPEWLRSITLLFPGKLILALDQDGSGLLVKGWREAASVEPTRMIELANMLPLGGVLFTNVAAEGRLGGVGEIHQEILCQCVHERIAAGGVSTVEDLRTLRRAGFAHVIVGKAFNAGGLDFHQAEEAMA